MCPSPTDEAAPGHVQVVASRGDPDPGSVGADQAGLALRLLGQEGHAQALRHALHRSLGGRGHAVGGLDEGLEQAALIKHHVVCDADLETWGDMEGTVTTFKDSSGSETRR